jgi:hypothetical protein
MKTYLTVMFSSEGASPSEVTNRLAMLGFKPLTGQWDFVYEWDKSADVQDAIFFGDKITQVLKGNNVIFKIETI